jgi:hypothetical protein
MIPVKPSPTSDSRTCEFEGVTKEMLLDSSRQHIADVGRGMAFFAGKITEAASVHDADKLTTIDWFLECFQGGFKDSSWWDNHRKINRHHLTKDDGVPDDVNLVDVIEFIVDCVMAGMARNGSVYPLELSSSLLHRAFSNTVELFKSQVVDFEVDEKESNPDSFNLEWVGAEKAKKFPEGSTVICRRVLDDGQDPIYSTSTHHRPDLVDQSNKLDGVWSWSLLE